MNTLFNSKFIADLPPDPSRAIRACIRRYWALLEESDRDNPCYEEALECLALVQVVAAKGRVTLQLPEVTGSLKEDLRKINDAFRKIAEEIDGSSGFRVGSETSHRAESQRGTLGGARKPVGELPGEAPGAALFPFEGLSSLSLTVTGQLAMPRTPSFGVRPTRKSEDPDR